MAAPQFMFPPHPPRVSVRLVIAGMSCADVGLGSFSKIDTGNTDLKRPVNTVLVQYFASRALASMCINGREGERAAATHSHTIIGLQLAAALRVEHTRTFISQPYPRAPRARRRMDLWHSHS